MLTLLSLGARLTLFGSSANGFGFRNSDMDICMTFVGLDMHKIDMKKAIRDVERIIRNCRFISNVTAIHSAKVPIVKFCFRNPEIEADISLYNLLAQRNTDLLLTYCRIDERIRPLGYALKHFAKVNALFCYFDIHLMHAWFTDIGKLYFVPRRDY